MKGLLATLAAAPAAMPLFCLDGKPVTAGHIRRTAWGIEARIRGSDSIYLHTASASLFLAGLFAAARERVAIVLPAHLQPDYLREIGTKTLLTDQATDHPSAVPLALSDADDAETSLSPPDPTLIFFTSGVTGAPKEIRKPLVRLDREAWTFERLWGGRAQRAVATVSHQHIYGMIFRIFWPVISGIVSEDRAADYWEQLAGRLTPETMLVTSPAHLSRPPGTLLLARSSPALVFSSGAALALSDAQAAFAQFGAYPIEILGSTETGGIAWREQIDGNALWTLFPGVHIETDDEGRMSVRSAVAGDDGEAVETGDRIDREGDRIRLLDRVDRVVKVEGKRVSLPRLEEALLALPWIADAAAVDLPSRNGALGAIVQLNAEGLSQLQARGAFRLSRELRAQLAVRLEPSERPKHWRFMAVPFNAQGKRVQSLLRAPFAANDHSFTAKVRTSNPLSAEIDILLTRDLIWFQGHFPDIPVFPGIAQIHLAVQWGEKLWDWRPDGANLSRVKFRRILRPNDRVVLSLTRDLARDHLKFAYSFEDIVASEGTIGADA